MQQWHKIKFEWLVYYLSYSGAKYEKITLIKLLSLCCLLANLDLIFFFFIALTDF